MEIPSITHLPPSEHERLEEALSEVYKCLERKVNSHDEVRKVLNEKVSEGIFEKLRNQQQILTVNKEIIFSGAGKKTAEHVIRRQRLAERLLKDVVSVSEEFIDPTACQLEHILSGEVEEAICTLLGHPQECPHGLTIPKGNCCAKLSQAVQPLIVSLASLRRGAKARLAYFVLKDNPEAERLLSSGLVPGIEFELIQTFPAFVVQAGQTQIAFDEQIAKSIFVRPLK